MTRNPLVDRFLKQAAVLERRTATDAYRGTSYAAPETIKVRWHAEVTVLRTDDGREITSNAHISTATEITEGDRLTDEAGRAREILRVRRNRDTRGRFSHYVGYLA